MAGLAGCQSERAPSFVSSDTLQDLIPAAQTVTVEAVNGNFGTPSDLVLASYLDIDYGTYTGTVEKLLPQDGVYRVRLNRKSPLADFSRLPEIRGAAVTITSAAASAEPEADPEENPEADGDGNDATDAAAEEAAGDSEPSVQLQVVSFVPGELQDSEAEVVGTLQVSSADGSPVSVAVSEGDEIKILGDTLQRGRNLYLRHCMHCHGVSGDGAGPTAEYFTIKPRDYRLGIFKFTSTTADLTASSDDLYRIIKLGIPGTYMPSFMLLPDEETRVIAEYVRWLAMRGQMEKKYVDEFRPDFGVERLETEESQEVETEFESDWAEAAQDTRERIEGELADSWSASDKPEAIVIPPESRQPATAESIRNGRKLFLSEAAACSKCHGEQALGNGPNTTEYSKNKAGEEYDQPGLYDDWGNPLKPRNLTSGVYRGGRRPVDLYRRIYAGIKGAQMPAAGNKLKPAEIWDLVNYVLSIPVSGVEPEAKH